MLIISYVLTIVSPGIIETSNEYSMDVKTSVCVSGGALEMDICKEVSVSLGKVAVSIGKVVVSLRKISVELSLSKISVSLRKGLSRQG